MSSAARSDIGATVAVRATVDILRRALDEGHCPHDIDMADVFQMVASHIAGAAEQVGCDQIDMATALIAAIVPAAPTSPDGSRNVCLAWLADVSAWLRNGSRWERLAGTEKHGMDRNALLHFLPHYADKVTVMRRDVPLAATLAVLTDGVSDALTDVAGGERWFAERWCRSMNLASFILDVSYEAPSQLDDRTAVVVWCGGNPKRAQ
jgi:Protein phosphatase 2C